LQIPPLLLQTLVENAVKHGVSHLPEGGKIVIVAGQKAGMLELKVKNPGKIRATETNRASSGIGLINSKRRLKLLYGERANVTIFNQESQVVCFVKIPIDTL
jgi:sensor histidine kinase YesM